MVTSRDVAKLAGVSVATVSRVYSDSNAVTDITARKVLDAARQLGYIPNTVARSLKSNPSRTVGLASPLLTRPQLPVPLVLSSPTFLILFSTR